MSGSGFPPETVTGVFVEEDSYVAAVQIAVDSLGFYVFGFGSNPLWSAANVGQTKTVRIYGR